MNFVSITSQTGFFQQGSSCGGKPYAGLIGFDRPFAELQGTNVFFDQLVANKGLPDVFAFQMCDDTGSDVAGRLRSTAARACRSTPLHHGPL